MSGISMAIKAALVVACMGIGPLGAHAGELALRVENDPGGELPLRVAEMKLDMQRGIKRVMLAGYCASACTLYLSPKWGWEVCAFPNARIGFHKPYLVNRSDDKVLDGDEGVQWANKMWMRAFIMNYPDNVRWYLAGKRIPSPAAGGSRNDVLWVAATELVPPCS